MPISRRLPRKRLLRNDSAPALILVTASPFLHRNHFRLRNLEPPPADNAPHGALAQSSIDSISSLQAQVSPTSAQNREEHVRWKRQELKKMAKADGISPDMGRMLTLTATKPGHTKTESSVPRHVLDSIQWDHPPNFSHRHRNDPRMKRMLEEAKASPLSDPYYLTRMARFSDQNHPLLFIRGEICDIETGDENRFFATKYV